MKAICVLLVLALAAFANADEAVMGQEVAAVEQVGAEAAEMQTEVDAVADEDEVVAEDEDEAEMESEDEVEADEEDEAVEESEDEDEAEDESEDEAEEEEEFSLIEAEAEAETDEERRRKPLSKKKRVKIVKAPKPLKAKPFKFHSERIVADSTKPQDPELAKLDLALAAVKEDILSTNKQITDERKWVIAVAKIIASYNDKMKRVEAHIIALRKEMKSLYRKKKQIENLKLQRALEAKLKEARDELATLTGSLKHIQVKNSELNKSGADLRATIAGIQAQLTKLRGQQLRKPKAAAKGRRCGKGKRFSRKQKKCVARKGRKAARKGRKGAKKF